MHRKWVEWTDNGMKESERPKLPMDLQHKFKYRKIKMIFRDEENLKV